MTAAARMVGADPLAREVKLAPGDLSGVDADGTFSGYASLFGEADLGRDMVMPGAFARSVAARRAAGIRMLFQHDPATRSARSRSCCSTRPSASGGVHDFDAIKLIKFGLA